MIARPMGSRLARQFSAANGSIHLSRVKQAEADAGALGPACSPRQLPDLPQSGTLDGSERARLLLIGTAARRVGLRRPLWP